MAEERELAPLHHGAPPIGIVISSMLSWDELSDFYGHLEDYWLPADGRPVPKETRLGALMDAIGQAEKGLPDLRGGVLIGAAEQEAEQRLAPTPLATNEGDAVSTQDVSFYYLRG